jgi:hypothetical protein
VEGNRPRPVKRIWVQQVAVDVEVLRTRLNRACARPDGLDPQLQVVAEGVGKHLDLAQAAAFRHDPLPGRLTNWWRGVLVEAAHRNMHAAQLLLVHLYDDDELCAEIPLAVARARATLHREDVRQTTVHALEAESPSALLRHRVRRLLSDSFAAVDTQHSQLRNFRNTVLLAALLIFSLVAITTIVVALEPDVMPLCFPNEVVLSPTPDDSAVTQQRGFNCPTGAGVEGPTPGDVLIVALIGLLGGALAASVSIRHLKGTIAPYNVPAALAMLKVPLGAFTAILALVAVRGDFVPGLTALDSQEQILAYALVFGFAQQLFTRLLDQQVQTVLQGLPSKDTADDPPPPPVIAHDSRSHPH